MNKVYELINKLGLPFQTDKILHFIAGFLITVIFSYMAYLQGLDYPQSYGIVLGVLAGIGKEGWDLYSYGKFDTYDMVSTWVGAFIGGALVAPI